MCCRCGEQMFKSKQMPHPLVFPTPSSNQKRWRALRREASRRSLGPLPCMVRHCFLGLQAAPSSCSAPPRGGRSAAARRERDARKGHNHCVGVERRAGVPRRSSRALHHGAVVCRPFLSSLFVVRFICLRFICLTFNCGIHMWCVFVHKHNFMY
jgi:hypothetical protein